MAKPRSIRQAELSRIRTQLEKAGIKTWGQIYRKRNDVASLLYIACSMLNPENPKAAYESIQRRRSRYLGGCKFDRGYEPTGAPVGASDIDAETGAA